MIGTKIIYADEILTKCESLINYDTLMPYIKRKKKNNGLRNSYYTDIYV